MKANFYNSTPSIRHTLVQTDLSHSVRTSLKPGYICPVEVREVLPGDVWDDRTNTMTRLTSSFIRPIADDIYLDLYHFFVPLRLCYKNIERVFNVQSSGYNTGTATDKLPVTTQGSSALQGSVADYLGVYGSYQDDLVNSSVAAGYSVLPFRAFALIWNYWFRNEQVDNPIVVPEGALATNEKINRNAWSTVNYMGMCPRANRYKDYFSSMMYSPQRGKKGAVDLSGVSLETMWNIDGDGNIVYPDEEYWGQSNATLDVKRTFAGIDFEAIRVAEALQKYAERGNIYGARYREYLNSAFGVNIPELQVQQPEFLGSAHTRLNVQSVAATADTTNYPVGQVAGMSHTFSSKDAHFYKSFNEHGYIISCAVIRYKHCYSQSVQRLWTRKERKDFYDPYFAHLGYQPIYQYQVYAPTTGSLTADVGVTGGADTVVGYTEAFADMRVGFDRVSGQMRPNGHNLGSFYSLADYYQDAPVIGDLVKEDGDSFDRVLSINQSTIDPFLVDFYFNSTVYRAITVNGLPS